MVLGAPRVFRDVGAVLAESPFWDDGALHWVDIVRGLLHVSPEDGAGDGSGDRVLELPAPLPCIQPAEGGGYVAALKDRIVLVDVDGTITAEIARVTLPNDEARLNEGKVDPQGSLFVGAMDADDADAAWYWVTGSGAAVHLGGFGVTNGLEWSLDGADRVPGRHLRARRSTGRHGTRSPGPASSPASTRATPPTAPCSTTPAASGRP